MSVEDNKRLVAAFNSHFERSDIDAILALLSEDVTWWINGSPDLFPVTGTIDKARFAEINRRMHGALDGGLRMEVIGMVAESDMVAAELCAHALTKDGRAYRNRYHMLYTVRDGWIVAVAEYTDLMVVAEAFALPTAPTGAEGDAYRSDAETALRALDAELLSGNKRIVADFLDRFERSDVDALLAHMTDDATWWVNGRPDLFPGAGTKSKGELGELLRRMFTSLEQPLRMQADTMVEEGDRVVARVRSDAVTSSGRTYRNGFLMHFVVRGDRIAAVREYTDLLTAADVFG
ncbi:nuclear transport factor 2 family protein [Methylobacterium sp. E-045]|uniref:nuclear transport factor 2 family protein n=1 Tax=Methylobacterium sp. E-045 TaxID=2836575 RepID=UPI001FBA6648|nr:nuclear transport factor 2 family protein [Methylobacterium sp. E-045]MCJ2130679.1 nuclear transport factor 2 family protein [Methylobacterium sp. E-045]